MEPIERYPAHTPDHLAIRQRQNLIDWLKFMISQEEEHINLTRTPRLVQLYLGRLDAYKHTLDHLQPE